MKTKNTIEGARKSRGKGRKGKAEAGRKNTVISAVVTVKERLALMAMADEEGVTLSEMIRVLLEEAASGRVKEGELEGQGFLDGLNCGTEGIVDTEEE